MSLNDKRTTNYKPYSLSEYKDMQSTHNSYKFGGLGANIGSEDWERAKRKREMQRQFAQSVKEQNMTKMIRRERQEQPKEISSREKAKMFAKNIPRPKPKPKVEDPNMLT